jgi:hypothetical protein
MVAKMLLPLFGGTPAVWNTCVFFFQAALLAGYGYAYVVTQRLKLIQQAVVHILLVLLPLPFLPIAIAHNWLPSAQANPILSLLTLLLVSVGLPFLVVSTSAPLLQRWFSYTGHVASEDPYFLYAASNSGSLLGLLSYPILIEPNLALTKQSWLWAGGYGLFILLTLACAIIVGIAGKKASTEDSNTLTSSKDTKTEPPTAREQAQWAILAFLPSSLLLGITTYLTTDVASVPFLWAIPLALYLLSFILMFAGRWKLSSSWLVYSLPIPVFILALPLVYKSQDLVAFVFHLLGFFAIACVLNGILASRRPSTEYLTLFYFWVSFGGMLGGLFNAIASPLVFSTLLEYPLVTLLSFIIIQASDQTRPQSKSTVWLSFLVCVGLLLRVLIKNFQFGEVLQPWIGILLVLGLVIVISSSYQFRRLQWGLGLGLVLLLCQFSNAPGSVLVTERSFFGVNRVLFDPAKQLHTLIHGTTIHGAQLLTPAGRRKPLGYYYPTGPIGQVFQSQLLSQKAHVAVLGLGAGGLSVYAQPNQQWTFYEIDPTIERIARDPRYFTFLRDSPAKTDVILGDGRLRLADAPEKHYNLIIMDAFSSDAVPVHLLTREALQIYLSKLAREGTLAIHISNRYIDLAPALGVLAKDLDLATLRQTDAEISSDERAQGKIPSDWVLMARHTEDFGKLGEDSRWHSLPVARNMPVWTDDFSNLFQSLRFLRSS